VCLVLLEHTIPPPVAIRHPIAYHVLLEATAELVDRFARLVLQGRTIPPPEALHHPLAYHVLQEQAILQMKALHLMLASPVQLEATAGLVNRPACPVLQGRTIPPPEALRQQLARFVLKGRKILTPEAIPRRPASRAPQVLTLHRWVPRNVNSVQKANTALRDQYLS
jgi:enoyl-CoA hydratase/carnithine racemase